MEAQKIFGGKYLLEKLIGIGNFAEVWLAKDTLIDVEVALKIYVPATGMDDHGLNILKHEFKILLNVNHPNVLKPMVYEISERRPFLVLPYCEKGSVFKQAGKMSERECWRLMRDVASGLAHLHSLQPTIIHQDIKPDNILVGPSGDYMMTDFGISTHARSALQRTVGDNFKQDGTRAYMAPERFGRDPKPTPENDVWSLGATLYEMLTGDVPFGFDGGLLQKSGAEMPEIGGGVSDDLKAVIVACMDMDPKRRPTARQLMESAEDALARRPNKLAKTLHPNATAMPRWVFIAAAIAGLLIGGAIAALAQTAMLTVTTAGTQRTYNSGNSHYGMAGCQWTATLNYTLPKDSTSIDAAAKTKTYHSFVLNNIETNMEGAALAAVNFVESNSVEGTYTANLTAQNSGSTQLTATLGATVNYKHIVREVRMGDTLDDDGTQLRADTIPQAITIANDAQHSFTVFPTPTLNLTADLTQAYIDETVTISADTRNNGGMAATYQWRRNDTEQSGQTAETLTQLMTQAGRYNYTCTARFSYQGTELYSQTSAVNVTSYAKPSTAYADSVSTISTFKGKTGQQGRTTLGITTTDADLGREQWTFQWYRDGVQMDLPADTRTITIDEENNLDQDIMNVSYSCTATCNFSAQQGVDDVVTTRTFTASVYKAPSTWTDIETTASKRLEVAHGQAFSLTAKHDGAAGGWTATWSCQRTPEHTDYTENIDTTNRASTMNATYYSVTGRINLDYTCQLVCRVAGEVWLQQDLHYYVVVYGIPPVAVKLPLDEQNSNTYLNRGKDIALQICHDETGCRNVQYRWNWYKRSLVDERTYTDNSGLICDSVISADDSLWTATLPHSELDRLTIPDTEDYLEVAYRCRVEGKWDRQYTFSEIADLIFYIRVYRTPTGFAYIRVHDSAQLSHTTGTTAETHSARNDLTLMADHTGGIPWLNQWDYEWYQLQDGVPGDEDHPDEWHAVQEHTSYYSAKLQTDRQQGYEVKRFACRVKNLTWPGERDTTLYYDVHLYGQPVAHVADSLRRTIYLHEQWDPYAVLTVPTTGGNDSWTYQWTDPDGTVTTDSIEHKAYSAGTYTLRMTNHPYENENGDTIHWFTYERQFNVQRVPTGRIKSIDAYAVTALSGYADTAVYVPQDMDFPGNGLYEGDSLRVSVNIEQGTGDPNRWTYRYEWVLGSYAKASAGNSDRKHRAAYKLEGLKDEERTIKLRIDVYNQIYDHLYHIKDTIIEFHVYPEADFGDATFAANGGKSIRLCQGDSMTIQTDFRGGYAERLRYVVNGDTVPADRFCYGSPAVFTWFTQPQGSGHTQAKRTETFSVSVEMYGPVGETRWAEHQYAEQLTATTYARPYSLTGFTRKGNGTSSTYIASIGSLTEQEFADRKYRVVFGYVTSYITDRNNGGDFHFVHTTDDGTRHFVDTNNELARDGRIPCAFIEWYYSDDNYYATSRLHYVGSLTNPYFDLSSGATRTRGDETSGIEQLADSPGSRADTAARRYITLANGRYLVIEPAWGGRPARKFITSQRPNTNY